MDLLRGSALRTAEKPVTRLLTVERDSNPLRRYGHVSPHIGKVAPLDWEALGEIADLAEGALASRMPGPTLVVGMAESALLLAWAIAGRLAGEVELRFTTRENRGTAGCRTFLEPHSHGPVHALALPPGSSYARVVIVEDELTSGATLRNLLLAVRDVAPSFRAVTLSDRRPPAARERLRAELAGLGVDLSVVDLSELATEAPGRRSGTEGGRRPQHASSPRTNPFGRPSAVFGEAVDALWRRCLGLRPDALYAVGECIDVAMSAWEALPVHSRPFLRHVTRSPWLVDGAVVRDRVILSTPDTPDHFLYNAEDTPLRSAAIVAESSTTPVAAKLSHLLASRGIETATVRVARA